MRMQESGRERRRPRSGALAVLVLALVSGLAGGAQAAPLWLGVAGDSLAQPYAEEANFAFFLTPANTFWPYTGPVPASPTPLSWVEQLRASRGASLQVDSWAVGGSDTTKLLAQGQPADLAAGASAAAAAGATTFAFFGIGTNDFQPFSFPGLTDVYDGVAACSSLASCATPFYGADGITYSSVDDYLDAGFARWSTAFGAIDASGASLVLSGIMDWGDAPALTLSARSSVSPLVSDAVAAFDQRVRDVAVLNGLPYIDFQGLMDAWAAGGLEVGGHALLPGPPGSARDPLYFFLPDGIHGDTVAQGLMANAVLTALNGAYGTGVPLLTDAEILAHAGLAPDPGWDGTSFDVSPYVLLGVPEPESGVLLGVVAVLAARSWRRRRPAAHPVA